VCTAFVKYSLSVEFRVPPFEPHPLLKNGHAMTIVSAFVPRRFDIPPAEARLFQVDAESRLLAHCHWQPGKRKDVPAIVVVHGLEGSIDSGYMRGIAEKAFHRGFHVVRMNQRNCGGTEALTPTLYNSGMSADYRAVFEELSNADGFQQIFFAGYSMGGNLVTRWLESLARPCRKRCVESARFVPPSTLELAPTPSSVGTTTFTSAVL